MTRPTEQAYNELQQAYTFFNGRLFGSALPHCLITMQRGRSYYGYFSPTRWKNRQGIKTDEIAMNPTHFANRSVEEVLSTLVHEMTHLWQHHFGKPGRGGYHNKQWADKMEEIGLCPSNTGKPGGSRTGDRMSHYIVDNGLFDNAQRALVAGGFTISWLDSQTGDGSRGKPATKNKNKRKYTCPDCGVNAWGKPGISLICGACNAPLMEEA